MTQRWFGTIMLLIGSSAIASSSFPPLKRQAILDARLPAGSPAATIVKGARIGFAPGQPTGRHRHPVSVAGVVTKGAFLFQPDGERPRIVHTGEAFFEPAGRVILHFDNASTKGPAEIEAFYLTDSDQRPLIEMLDQPASPLKRTR